MKITSTELPGVVIIEVTVFEDDRGTFFEVYRDDEYVRAGIPRFVQENQSLSRPTVLRGLHYQLDRPQGKLVRVLAGAIMDVAVDIRRSSPSFGKWTGVELSAANRRQLYVPPGFAHGFCVLGDTPAEVLYRCTDYYSGAADQRGVAWNDPSIGIRWPTDDPLLSEKDRTYGRLLLSRVDLPSHSG